MTEHLVVDAARRLVAEHPPASTPTEEFLGARFDAGLAWVHFPRGLGGLGVAPGLQGAADAVVEAAGGPNPFDLNPMGYGMAAPTVLAHGSPALHERLLRPLYTCEEIWCQLFSEPGAGSDLAGLATRAVRDGDGWRATGQKVWTSKAHEARWALLLARTDPDVPKHKGLTYFVLDMRDPGVEVRPLRQLTGDAEFNEVWLRDARLDDAWRLGDVGAGWKVAMTTLMNERTAIGGGSIERGSGSIGDALALWRSQPDPGLRDRIVTLFARADALRLTGMRHAAERGDGPAGPMGSLGKLVGAELNQAVYELCVDLLGTAGTRHPGYDGDPATHDTLTWKFLRSRANTIEGGTAEVLRGILAERVLGLPGDIRVDKDTPWREVPRG
ncbi:acyl-CoA dehydrogenase family protein [Actinophytocola gossypii]|uniref:Acyl-CoA dehydrogenase family protein n=1 Tax=Actinophytocola gossypii TaxID=2812003 RepID=A0ABT2J6P1_9PSEU|nr:acyl-CoA dehydrogenase family protein [Actinophytocola gossypii]MCT2583527.1 acyl-CoA dehydrogenase family protein [Actinophytocola gossypii]